MKLPEELMLDSKHRGSGFDLHDEPVLHAQSPSGRKRRLPIARVVSDVGPLTSTGYDGRAHVVVTADGRWVLVRDYATAGYSAGQDRVDEDDDPDPHHAGADNGGDCRVLVFNTRAELAEFLFAERWEDATALHMLFELGCLQFAPLPEEIAPARSRPTGTQSDVGRQHAPAPAHARGNRKPKGPGQKRRGKAQATEPEPLSSNPGLTTFMEALNVRRAR